METMKNQDLQDLEQVSGIIASLDSYIAAALQKIFGLPQPGEDTPKEAPTPPDELRQVHLPDQVVLEWESSATNQREALQRQLAEAEAQVAALKAKLYDLTVAE